MEIRTTTDRYALKLDMVILPAAKTLAYGQTIAAVTPQSEAKEMKRLASTKGECYTFLLS